MAVAVNVPGGTGPDTKVSRYHRTLSLNIDCGSDVILRLIEKQLHIDGTTFQAHISNHAVQNRLQQLKKQKVLNRYQLGLLNAIPPDLSRMDITLLSTIALEIFRFTSTIKTHILSLRNTRNEIIHKSRTQLDDDTLFNDSERLIIELAREVNCETEERLRKQIEDLKMRELVKTRTNLDLIILHGEALMVKLVETDGTERADDFCNAVLIKHRLTQWVRYLSRVIEVDVLLQKLTENGIIEEQRKRHLEKLYNYEEQMYCLVLHMMSADQETLLKLIVCLRELDGHAADLIEGRENDAKQFGKRLLAAEKENVNKIVSSALVTKIGSYVACEDIHIFVDEERKYPTKFDIIRDCIKEAFPEVSFEENDSQFHGITWKDETKFHELDQTEEQEENISDLPCDKFAEYLGGRLEKLKEGIGAVIKATVLDEVLSSKVFAKLSMDQLKDIFSPGLESISTKFATGIKLTFQGVQQDIENQSNIRLHTTKGVLRKFDFPTGNTVYKPEIVVPETGNLIVAAHEFVLPALRHCNNAFIAKEIVRFATACINGKKNGTIHFGIKEKGNGQGEIVGLPKEINLEFLKNELQYAIRSCFDVMTVDRCMRPIQCVPVEDKGIVLEVDIVPRACHLDKYLLHVKFPPKGNQRKKCFVYNNKDNQIVTIEESKYNLMQTEFESLHKERKQLDTDIQTPNKDISFQKRLKLKKLLTGGAKFVTDAYVPVICCGEITGCQDEENIRCLLAKMGVAFTSSLAVLDFDDSVTLRHLIEKDKTNFRIKLAEDYSTERKRKESGLTEDDCVWIYSNGNKEHGKHKLKSENWYERRFNGVRTAFANIRQEIPSNRGLLLFLVFQKTIDFDPMLEIARDALTSSFVNECVIIAENDNIISDWMKELQGKVNNLHKKVLVGLEWQDIVSEISNLFKPRQDCSFKFPDSRGNIVELTPKDKDDLNLQDNELIDCGYKERFRNLEEEHMSQDDARKKRHEEESMFYKGNRVTWWNLYYQNQVGHRNMYEIHRRDIKMTLVSNRGEERYEQFNIDHHPGAGGTTLGRQLLWYFSQLKHDIRQTYRCCIINRITTDTAEEIYRFQSFKESPNANPKPVIALIDNGNEELISALKFSLDEVAYKKGTPNELFCILLFITRVPVSCSDKRGKILEHRLSTSETMWFEKKFIDLQTVYGVKVNTLFAFNVLRKSFDPSFIEKTTAQLMAEVSKTEMKVLQSLSLFCSFDSDHPVPESVFDSVMMDTICTSNLLSLYDCGGRPFGLVWTQREREARKKENREMWNVHLTEAMQLFITHRSSERFSCSAVSILSQPLAKAIVHYIITQKCITFENIVNELLELVEIHCSETNTMSKEFVKNVCSLFKTRAELVDDKGGTKQGKFSTLIFELEKPAGNETTEASQKRVVRIMKRCMDVTKDPFVGQQLARYLYHMKDFDAAEDAIKRSLEAKPHNSYLLDTYGQIYRSKMDFVIGMHKDMNLNDEDAVEYIKLALSATEKFKQAQKEASSSDEDKNLNCYLMEVQTILCLLEHFHKFDCFVDRENFWKFLNDPTFPIQDSSFSHVLHLIPEVEQFRNGQSGHQHMDESLRNLEENAYMTRANPLTQFTIPNNDVLLLGPREKFEYFYGSKEHTMNFEFRKGVGLKLLMKAHEKQKELLSRRANEAFHRLQHESKDKPYRKILKQNDLLVYLGYSIIVLSNGEQKCDTAWFKNLLRYSTQLFVLQRSKQYNERKYIEAYLYYALLHWLLPKRTDVESHPNTYKKMIEEWEKEYMKNLNVKGRDQLFKKKPKIYFALGNGSPGDDILDEECLRHKWRDEMFKLNRRKRKEVKADNHWLHPIFESRHQRLSGIVDDSGRRIETKVFYKENEYTFHIHTNDDCSSFSNRPVTFVMGFSWMAPTALDVRKEGLQGNGKSNVPSQGNQGVRPKDIHTTGSKSVKQTNTKDNDANRIDNNKSGRNLSLVKRKNDEQINQRKSLSTELSDRRGTRGNGKAHFTKQDHGGARPKDINPPERKNVKQTSTENKGATSLGRQKCTKKVTNAEESKKRITTTQRSQRGAYGTSVEDAIKQKMQYEYVAEYARQKTGGNQASQDEGHTSKPSNPSEKSATEPDMDDLD